MYVKALRMFYFYGEKQQGRVEAVSGNKCIVRWGKRRQAGDSIINYRNACLDGEKQKSRLETEP